MTATHLGAALGGSGVLGRDVRSDLDIADLIEQGLPLQVIEIVLKSGMFVADDLHGLVLSRRTLAYRRANLQRLSLEQSNRIARAVWAMLRRKKHWGRGRRHAGGCAGRTLLSMVNGQSICCGAMRGPEWSVGYSAASNTASTADRCLKA